MRMRNTLLTVATAALGVGLLHGTALHGTAQAETSDVKLAPEIEVLDWINGDGRTSLADFRGGVVLLEFWSSH